MGVEGWGDSRARRPAVASLTWLGEWSLHVEYVFTYNPWLGRPGGGRGFFVL